MQSKPALSHFTVVCSWGLSGALDLIGFILLGLWAFYVCLRRKVFWQVTAKFVVVRHISYLGIQLCHTRAGPKCLRHKQASKKTPQMPELDAIHPSMILTRYLYFVVLWRSVKLISLFRRHFTPQTFGSRRVTVTNRTKSSNTKGPNFVVIPIDGSVVFLL